MKIAMEKLSAETLSEALAIWNQVVEAGRAFPQLNTMTLEEGRQFFAAQTYTGVAREVETAEIVGMYILHPNNVGRCGHLCNASYAVRQDKRGLKIGEALVRDCMKQAKLANYRILQFNAVVKSNISALKLYQRLGFKQLGTIPGGFLNCAGEYEDIIPHYIELN